MLDMQRMRSTTLLIQQLKKRKKRKRSLQLLDNGSRTGRNLTLLNSGHYNTIYCRNKRFFILPFPSANQYCMLANTSGTERRGRRRELEYRQPRITSIHLFSISCVFMSTQPFSPPPPPPPSATPTTNGGMQNRSLVGIFMHNAIHIFARLVSICILSR